MIRTAVPPSITNMVTGINCSKDYFDVSVLKDHKVIFEGRFNNDSSGFNQLLVHILGSHVSMEATNPCYFQAKEKEIEALIKKNYTDLAKNLRGIPGIGPRSASLLIISTDGLKMFESYKKLVSYFGLAPSTYESGSSVKGKSHICKMGMGQIRRYCTWLPLPPSGAIRHVENFTKD